MKPGDESTPLGTAAVILEVVLCVAGVAVLIWLLASARGRALRVRRLAPWSISGLEFACFALAGISGSFVASALAGLVSRWIKLSADASTVAGSAVMEGGFLLGVLAFYVRSRRGQPRARPRVAYSLWTGAVTFAIAMPLVFLSSNLWEWLLARLGLPHERQALLDVLEGTQSTGLRWAFLGIATLLVPVVEELVFRGGLFRYFSAQFPRWFALSFSALLFGAPHVEWSHRLEGLPSLAPLVVLAYLFSLAYEVTGCLGTTIVAHALFNLNMIGLVLAGVGS